MATQRDIAERCGVSPMTVSLALRNSPLITESKRQVIQRAAQEMDYRPDPLVAALMANRRRNRRKSTYSTIAYLSPISRKESARHDYLAHFQSGVQKRALALGYGVEYFCTEEPRIGTERLDKILKARGINALIIVSNPLRNYRLDLDWHHYFSVQFGNILEYPAIHQVENDQIGMMCTILRKLKELGYRRPGFALSGSIEEDFAEKYWLMPLLAFQRQQHQTPAVPIYEEPTEQGWDEKPFMAWFREHRPDVVIAIDQYPLLWLRKNGVRIPEDCGFVCTNLPPEESKTSGMFQNFERIGHVAIDLLQSQIHNNQPGIPGVQCRMLNEALWNDGQTLRELS